VRVRVREKDTFEDKTEKAPERYRVSARESKREIDILLM